MPDAIITIPDGPDQVITVDMGPESQLTSKPDLILTFEGPPGVSGAASARLVYHQTSASASWLIVHQLGAYPEVQLLSDELVLMDSDVEHIDDQRVSVTFAVPTSGYAVLT